MLDLLDFVSYIVEPDHHLGFPTSILDLHNETFKVSRFNQIDCENLPLHQSRNTLN